MDGQTRSWVKLDRSVLNWGWYQNANTMRLFIHLILTANIKDQEFMGVVIHRGEVATSYLSLSRALNISISAIRTSISHLKMTGEITTRIYPKFQVISIENYGKYQGTPTGKIAGKSQASRRQVAGESQQSKNIKNGRMEEKERARDEWETRCGVPDKFRGRFNSEREWLEFTGEADKCDMS